MHQKEVKEKAAGPLPAAFPNRMSRHRPVSKREAVAALKSTSTPFI